VDRRQAPPRRLRLPRRLGAAPGGWGGGSDRRLRGEEEEVSSAHGPSPAPCLCPPPHPRSPPVTPGHPPPPAAPHPPPQIIKQQLADGVSQRRVGFVSSGAPARQHSEITTADGKRVGEVTSGAFSPCLKKNIAMGWVPAGVGVGAAEGGSGERQAARGLGGRGAAWAVRHRLGGLLRLTAPISLPPPPPPRRHAPQLRGQGTRQGGHRAQPRRARQAPEGGRHQDALRDHHLLQGLSLLAVWLRRLARSRLA
jgi:hypothetical protein